MEIVPKGKPHQTLPFSEKSIYHCVKNAIANIHGDFAVASLQHSLNVKYLNPYTRILLIRAKRAAHKMVITALSFTTKIEQTEVIFRTIQISGTIRQIQKYLVVFHQRRLAALLSACETEEEKAAVQASIVRVDEELEAQNAALKKENAEESEEEM